MTYKKEGGHEISVIQQLPNFNSGSFAWERNKESCLINEGIGSTLSEEKEKLERAVSANRQFESLQR